MRDNKWVQLLACVTGLVNQRLLLQNEYLAAENRILRSRLPSRLRLSDPERSTLPQIGKRVGPHEGVAPTEAVDGTRGQDATSKSYEEKPHGDITAQDLPACEGGVQRQVCGTWRWMMAEPVNRSMKTSEVGSLASQPKSDDAGS